MHTGAAIVTAPRNHQVKLRYGYVIKAERVTPEGVVVCSHDPESLHGEGSLPKDVKGVIHWVIAW